MPNVAWTSGKRDCAVNYSCVPALECDFWKSETNHTPYQSQVLEKIIDPHCVSGSTSIKLDKKIT